MHVRRLAGACVVLFALSTSTGFATDTEGEAPALAVGEILAEPEPFHLKYVTVHGTVTHLTLLAPYSQSSGASCYGAYTFLLEDETGALPVSVLGFCGKPRLREPEVADGDRIVLEAQIHADAIIGIVRAPDGAASPHPDQDPVYAVAMRIRIDRTPTSADLPSH